MWVPEPSDDNTDHPVLIASVDDGVPLYEVPGMPEGVECLIGTNYPNAKKESFKLIIHIGFGELKAIPLRLLVRGVRRFLSRQVVANAYSDAVHRLAAEQPGDLPGQHARHDREAVLFWFYPPVATGVHSSDGQPSLAIRTRFSEGNRGAIKSAMRSPGFNAGTWMPDPWRLWVVKDMAAAPTVLSALRTSFTFRWVTRAGFPGAPPLP